MGHFMHQAAWSSHEGEKGNEMQQADRTDDVSSAQQRVRTALRTEISDNPSYDQPVFRKVLGK